MKRYKLKLHGIGLIDLLMTMMILAMLMTLSVPSYRIYVDKNRIFNLTRQLVEALNVTKQLAIKRGQSHYLNIKVNSDDITSSESCWVISDSENCDCFTSTTLCQAKYGQVSAAIKNVDISSNRPSLSFSPLFGSTNGATYRLSIAGYAIKVIVSTQGRIRGCMETGASAIYAAC